MRITIAFSAGILLLSGCAQKPITKPEAVIVIDAAKRQPPADAMVACPDLGALDSDEFGAVVRKLGSASEMYKQCEQKRLELQKFIQGDLPKLPKLPKPGPSSVK